MPTIESIVKGVFDFLKKAKELGEPSIRELGNALGWNYQRAHTFAKALEEIGLIKLEWTRGPPQRFVIKLTDKGQCIVECVSRDSFRNSSNQTMWSKNKHRE